MRPEERPLGVKGSPWLRAVKQTGPQPCNPKEQNSNNNLNKLVGRFFPRASRKESSSAHTLICSVKPRAEEPVESCSARTSDP